MISYYDTIKQELLKGTSPEEIAELFSNSLNQAKKDYDKESIEITKKEALEGIFKYFNQYLGAVAPELEPPTLEDVQGFCDLVIELGVAARSAGSDLNADAVKVLNTVFDVILSRY